jgi:hypothetical protein
MPFKTAALLHRVVLSSLSLNVRFPSTIVTACSMIAQPKIEGMRRLFDAASRRPLMQIWMNFSPPTYQWWVVKTAIVRCCAIAL